MVEGVERGEVEEGRWGDCARVGEEDGKPGGEGEDGVDVYCVGRCLWREGELGGGMAEEAGAGAGGAGGGGLLEFGETWN